MKRLILLLFTGMMFLSVFAEEKSIELQKRACNVELRSLTLPPTVTHDGNILYIYSDIPLENLQVVVTDLSTGEMLHFDNITTSYGQPYILFLNEKKGNYKIELNIGQTCYWGFFNL